MNLTTDQLLFLAGIINEMSQRGRAKPLERLEGKFAIRLEWSKKQHADGEYILRGVQEENVTRG